MTTHACPLSARSSLPRALIGRRPHDTSYDTEFQIGELVEVYQTKEAGRVVGRLQIEDEMTSFLIRLATGAQRWFQECELDQFQTA